MRKIIVMAALNNQQRNAKRLKDVLLKKLQAEQGAMITSLQREVDQAFTSMKTHITSQISSISAQKDPTKVYQYKINKLKAYIDKQKSQLQQRFTNNETTQQDEESDEEGPPTWRRTNIPKDISKASVLCRECNRKFRNLIGLGIHMKKMHETLLVRTFKCIHCKLLYQQSLALANHLIQVHGEVGVLKHNQRRFYIESQTKQVFHEPEDLRQFIIKTDIFAGFNETDQPGDVEMVDLEGNVNQQIENLQKKKPKPKAKAKGTKQRGRKKVKLDPNTIEIN